MKNNITSLPVQDFKFIGADAEIEKIITRPSISFWVDVRRRALKNKVFMFGLFFIFLVLVLSIVIPEVSTYSYRQQNLSNINAASSVDHWFGTDSLGRDLWVRVWVGGRVSLAVGVLGSVIPCLIGIVIGGISGYFGGKLDMIIMRIVDVIMCIPFLIYIILIMLYIGSGPVQLIIAFALTGWMGMARNVRGLTLQLKEQDFVLASRALGASHYSLIFHHIIPNTLGIVIVGTTLSVPMAIFAEAYLSFIGLGIKPPIPSWGQLASSGITVLRIYPFQLLIPAIMISITMLSFNLVGNGLRDAVDPKLRN